MRQPSFFLFRVVLLLLCAPSVLQAQEGPSPVPRYSKTQLSDDVSYMVRTMESVHPNLYHSISQQKFYKLRDSVLSVLRDSMTVLEAWAPMARLAAAVNEGHTVLYMPNETAAILMQQHTGLFPVVIRRIAREGLVVAYDLSPDSVLHRGDLITAINGRTARQVVDQLTSVVGGLRSWRESRIEREVLTYMHLLGIYGPYKIQYIHGGQKRTATLQPLPLKTILQQIAILRKTQPPVQTDPYSFDRTADGAGVLSINTMEGAPEAFKLFLEQTFTDIRDEPIKGLIIDLRRNGGGNSYLGDLLLQYITSRPYRMTGGVHWKVSQELKDQYAKMDSASKTGERGRTWAEYISMKNGAMIRSEHIALDTPAANPLRYRGPVCVLIGPGTFSSANMTANTIQDYKLATLIGEPTGERPNDYGDVYKSRLPNTGVEFWTSTKLFLRANGNSNDPNPVLPDITIKQNRTSSKDDVLEYAKKWVREQAAKRK